MKLSDDITGPPKLSTFSSLLPRPPRKSLICVKKRINEYCFDFIYLPYPTHRIIY